VPQADAIRADGLIVEALNERIFRVELANGHRFVARPCSRLRLEFVRLAPGDRVRVELSPYDLSKGRIVLKQD
jgi:translation initiation factor IF-1